MNIQILVYMRNNEHLNVFVYMKNNEHLKYLYI